MTGKKTETVLTPASIKSRGWVHLRKCYWLYIFLIPGLLLLLLFKYLPMAGLVIVFQEYSVIRGYSGSPWVGFKNFELLFSSISFLRVLRNSLLNSIYRLLWSFPMPILLAIMLNEIPHDKYKRTLQTIMYLPHFISWVVVVGMMNGLLGMASGNLVNEIIVRLDRSKIAFLTDARYYRAVMIGSSVWKGTGWGTVVYLAALAGIDPALYDSALIDGANRIQRIRYITFPCILSTITVMLILRLGDLMTNSFEQTWLLQNSLNKSVAEVFETYSYQVGLRESRYSYSAAVGLFQSAISCLLIFSSNFISKKTGGDGLW